MRYFVTSEGEYIGAFDIDAPDGGLEVPFPPADARQAWDGEQWGPVPAEVPQVVSKAQGIRALYDFGVLDQVEALVAAADRATQLAWDTVSEFHRDSPMIAAVGEGLDLDALFIHAVTIKL